MKLILNLLLVAILSLVFNGCSYFTKEAPLIQIKTVYIKQKVLRLKNLPNVPNYIVTDITIIDEDYYKVGKADLTKASATCKKRQRIIKYYRTQNDKFNKRYKH